MHQAVAAGEDVDEGAELGDVDYPTHVGGAHLGQGRGDDRQDSRLGILHAPGLDGTDGDDALGAVVVDGDVGTGLLGDGVDDLALGPDDLADLVHRDGDGDDLRCRGGHFGPSLSEAGVHVVEDRQTGFFGLVESSRQHFGGDSVDLRVEL